jgi:hypothetical protein
VFAGRFTLEDAESVCTSDDVPAARVLDVLSSLVDKSLVMKVDARGPACYRLHETMREFAGLKLEAAGEGAVVELRCVEYYVSRCRVSEEGPWHGLVEWLAWMDLEIDNIRWVLRRCLAHADISRGMELAASIPGYWATRATTEGVRWLDELLASGLGDPEPEARALYLRGFLAVLLVDPIAARPALERAAAADRGAGRLRPLAKALSMASIAANMAGDRASARRSSAAAALRARLLCAHRARRPCLAGVVKPRVPAFDSVPPLGEMRNDVQPPSRSRRGRCVVEWKAHVAVRTGLTGPDGRIEPAQGPRAEPPRGHPPRSASVSLR